jgi:xylulokinase
MSKKIIAYDLGTSGNKASLYDIDGNCLATAFVPYVTYYPQVGWHEQSPDDWWNAVVESTQLLLTNSGVDKESIDCLAISGHSLGAVPIAKNGNLLRKTTPIWSDARAEKEVESFFRKIAEKNWYLTTGNGFPPALYTIFKVMWYQNNEPEMFNHVSKILGTKDYVNFRLTGKIKTDYSYASGSGIYSLKNWGYDERLISASGISSKLFPDIVPSTHILGELNKEAANILGLSTRVKVVCGGVDNSCMALGAKNVEEGRVYTSLGSSSWIAVSSEHPILDAETKPYIFAHVIPNMFTSAVSIFASGSSFRWVRDNICSNLSAQAKEANLDPYDLMTALAAKAPVGSNGLLFNPSLAGGTSQDSNAHIRGAYMGIDLKHGQSELIRSCMEGIALNLRLRLDILKKYCNLQDEMLLVGGGSKSSLFCQIFADVYNTTIVKTNIGQDAGSLGAAAIAAVGCGLWKDFYRIDEIHKVNEIIKPFPENNQKYENLLPVFEFAANYQAKISEMLHGLDLPVGNKRKG